MTNLVKDYMRKREAFGKALIHHPLHTFTVAKMEAETRGCTLLVFECCRLIGLQETEKLSEKENIFLRLLIVLSKLYTAKQAISVTSEGIESFGGIGYLENTDIPRMLRDTQVLPIWEGTTNLLSLEVLKFLEKVGPIAFEALSDQLLFLIKDAISVDNDILASCSKLVMKDFQITLDFAKNHSSVLQIAAREFSYSLARILGGAYLIRHSTANNMAEDTVTAVKQWCLLNGMNQLKQPEYYKEMVMFS